MSAPANPFAFPSPDDGRPSDGYGMTLRDWFAGQALAGEMASQGVDNGEWNNNASDDAMRNRAGLFYRFADAMLAERAK